MMVIEMTLKAKRLWQALNMAWHRDGFSEVARVLHRYVEQLLILWARFWMRYSGLTPIGRLATWLATRAPLPYFPYYDRHYIATFHPLGYVAPSATVSHPDLRRGSQVFIGERVSILGEAGTSIRLGDRVRLNSEVLLRTSFGGRISIGAKTFVGPRCQLMAYQADIRIGNNVLIGPNSDFFPYDHDVRPGRLIAEQALQSKGDIVIEDDVWIGTRVVVLSGVHIGKGAVIAAGAVVSRDVPAGTVAAGVPARIVKRRGENRDSLLARQTVLLRAADGTIWLWNKGAEHMYGWTPEETIGQTSHRLLQTQFPMPLDRIESELRQYGYWEGTLVHRRRDGTSIVVASRWETLRAPSGPMIPVLEVNQDLAVLGSS
jgi:PAS domain S-box-containing protein